jgi:hypothetical protein
MKRLMEEMVLAGSRARMRHAGAPTSGGPEAGKWTREVDYGRGEAVAVGIGEEDGEAGFHHTDEGVGGAEVYAGDHGVGCVILAHMGWGWNRGGKVAICTI